MMHWKESKKREEELKKGNRLAALLAANEGNCPFA